MRNRSPFTGWFLLNLVQRMAVVSMYSSVLNRWKNFFNQMLNIHGVHNVRQMDIKMKSYKCRVLIKFQPN
jgi:hypothetical protein